MSDSRSIEQARVAIEEILEVLQISRVICVDDNYKSGVQLEDVLIEACSLDGDKLKEVFPELGESIPDDEDVRKKQIRKLWPDLDKTVRDTRGNRILVETRLKSGKNVEDDDADTAIMGELIPQEKLQTLSPSQWKRALPDGSGST